MTFISVYFFRVRPLQCFLGLQKPLRFEVDANDCMGTLIAVALLFDCLPLHYWSDELCCHLCRLLVSTEIHY